MAAFSLLAGGLGAATLTLDYALQYQTLEGLGSSTRTGDSHLKQAANQDYYIQDFGASMFRVFMDYTAMPNAKSPAASINYETDFNLTGAAKWNEIPIELKTRYPDLRLIGTFWSPPAWMKASGATDGGDPATNVLLSQYEDHYAYFLAESIRLFDEHFQAPLYALSIQNELLFDEPYASCIWTPEQYFRVVKKLCQILDQRGVEIILFGPEHMTKDYGRALDFLRPLLADPVTAPYFQVAAAHGYTNGVEGDANPTSASQFWDKAASPNNLRFWMTETSGDPHTWDGALDGVAGAVHNALVYGHASAYTYWLANHESVSHGEELFEAMQPTKKSYAFQHFCKYIRPGAIRVALDPANDSQLNVSAWIHPIDGTMTAVLLNRYSGSRQVDLTVLHETGIDQFTAHRTSSTDNFARLTPLAIDTTGLVSFVMPARSMVTLQGTGGSFPLPEYAIDPEVLWVPAEGGTFPVTVTPSLPGFRWLAESNKVWAKITEGADVTGPGTVQVKVTATIGETPREALLTIANRTVKLTQSPPNLLTTGMTDLGGGWKWGAFGFFYDAWYPYLWVYGLGGWVYVLNTNGTTDGFFVYDYRRAQWGWSGPSMYPIYYLLDGSGQFHRLDQFED